MRHFEQLRTIPWEPRFHTLEDEALVADRINRPHEDYPRYVQPTLDAMRLVKITGFPSEQKIQEIHMLIFHDDKPSQWRKANVGVGLHVAPQHQIVPKLMRELCATYEGNELTEDRIQEWYFDFETIHPFVDGNGRVGGVVIALLSHQVDPMGRYMAPGQ